MAGNSLLEQTKRLEAEVGTILTSVTADDFSREQNDMVAVIRRVLNDARQEVRAYEYAETRVDQIEAGRIAARRLQHARKDILKASEQDIFSAIDVAQLTARIEQIISHIE